MGLALPNPKYDDQFYWGTMQAERIFPPPYGRIHDPAIGTRTLPRLRLWGLSSRWASLPKPFRRILFAGFVLALFGAFSSSALIQADSARGAFEEARYSRSNLQERLDEVEYIAPSYKTGSYFIIEGLD